MAQTTSTPGSTSGSASGPATEVPEPSVAGRSRLAGVTSDDELAAFLRAFGQVFGHTNSDDDVARFGRRVDWSRLVVARDDRGATVGTAGAYTFDLALPWAPPAGCAGVTLVSVRADHRRRGVLTRMMGELLDDAAARGEPFAALWASEIPIYGRYGFGSAIPTAHLEIDRRHAALRVPTDAGRVRLVDVEEAATVVPGIYERHRASRPGMLSRSEVWWRERMLLDDPAHRDGAGELRVAVVDDLAYALHRLKPAWDNGAPTGTVVVEDLAALDPAATAALWGFLLDTDLAVRVEATRRPVDDPVLAMLVDGGRATVHASWPLQLRLVDVPAALTARGYAVDGEAVLAVHDAFRPANDATWRLVVRDGRATCERVGGPDDGHLAVELHLGVDALASVVLGGVRTTSLYAAGRVTGDPAAAARLDRLVATDVAPWHGGMF